jgi:hypothetical protein
MLGAIGGKENKLLKKPSNKHVKKPANRGF